VTKELVILRGKQKVSGIGTLPTAFTSCLRFCPLRTTSPGAIFPTGFPQPFATSSRFSA